MDLIINRISTKIFLILICFISFSCQDNMEEEVCRELIPVCLSEGIQNITTFFVDNEIEGLASIGEYELNGKEYFKYPVYGWNTDIDAIVDIDCNRIGNINNGEDIKVDSLFFLANAKFKCNVWEY